MAADAVDKMPPHQPPPPPPAAACVCWAGVFFSLSWCSELVALGVRPALWEPVLSADLRAVSIAGGGVLVDVRFMGESFGSRMRGVCGRDGVFSPSWFSSSARISRSAASALAFADVGFALVVFLMAVSSPMPSNRSPSSSSVGGAFDLLLAIMQVGSEARGRVCKQDQKNAQSG
jgi:hypothetical protein